MLSTQKNTLHGSSFGTEADYVEAFRTVRITSAQALMLRAHANAPGQRMAPADLARAGGYTSYSTANSQYGTLAHRVADVLGAAPSETTTGGKPLWSLVLAYGHWDSRGRWYLKMRKEVVAALRKLNMA